jgi:hypothetical protein
MANLIMKENPIEKVNQLLCGYANCHHLRYLYSYGYHSGHLDQIGLIVNLKPQFHKGRLQTEMMLHQGVDG